MAGFSWSDALAAYFQYQAAQDASKPGKVGYSITPQMEELFRRMMSNLDYSPTRDYVNSAAHSFLQSQNAPGGVFDYKPTFKSEYMKDNVLPNMPRIDFNSSAIFKGDTNGLMPWNARYTGPGATGGGSNANTGPKGVQNADGTWGPISPGYYNPDYTTRQGGMAGVGRNNNMGGFDNPGNPGGFQSTHGALPGPPNPADGAATWNAIQNGLATIGKNGELIWKATGAVLGFLILGPGGIPVGVKAGDQVYNWTNKPGAPAGGAGGAGGAGAGAGNAGGN